jgi:predicted nucleic acid-binding protein
MIVVDANVIFAACVQNPFSELAQKAREKERWAAPTLWRSEVRSFTKLIRSKMLSLEDAQQLYQRAEYFMFCREFSVRSEKVLEYASSTPASPYDCEYIVMAEDFGTLLVTTDEPLIVHFPKIAIHLRDYMAG